MKIKSFRIENFKGIKKCVFNIENSSNQIITLIGLNESGKTTVLEAMATFLGEDADLLSIIGSQPARKSTKDLFQSTAKQILPAR